MTEKPLTKMIEEAMGRQDLNLPVFNRVALKLQQTISQDDYSSDDIAKIVQQDQALATHVLKVANSAFYSGLSPVKTIQEAAVRIGANSINSIALMIAQKTMYRTRIKQFKQWVSLLWSHALSVAVAAKWLAQGMGFHTMVEEAFMAGLLHDIGKLLLLRIIDELLVSRELSTRVSVSLVREIIDNLHTEYGQNYLARLNMPPNYYLVAGRHHDKEVTGANVVLNLVRLGNLASHKLGIGMKHNPDLMLSATPEAINLMAKDLVLAELQVKLEELTDSISKFV